VKFFGGWKILHRPVWIGRLGSVFAFSSRLFDQCISSMMNDHVEKTTRCFPPTQNQLFTFAAFTLWTSNLFLLKIFFFVYFETVRVVENCIVFTQEFIEQNSAYNT
jgi:hypothetical protein